MTEKVKMTQEQDAKLKEMLGDVMYSKDSILTQRSKGWREGYKTCLNTLSLGQLARVLFEPNSYEVEPQYKKGDWVVRDTEFRTPTMQDKYKNYRTDSVFEIMSIHNDYVIDENGANHDPSNVRHATSDEIKTEKERRLWKSIGREVGEFKKGDIRIQDDGNSVRITAVDYARVKYIQGRLKGFYPVESFISFESEGES